MEYAYNGYCSRCGRKITSTGGCECSHSKLVSKPPTIAGDQGTSGTPTYPCPTCSGKGYLFFVGISEI